MLITLGMVIIFRIWSIRSQAPKRVKNSHSELVQRMEKVQRLDGSGYEESEQL
jgi:hypothetical protein